MIRHRPGCESTETTTFVGRFGDTLLGCVECRAWTVAQDTPTGEAPPITRADSITRALEREKCPRPPAGWPTHKHRARTRRRALAARRRLARREARNATTTTREDPLT